MQQSINQAERHFISQGRFVFSQNDVLGKGATGIVYKGYDTHENKEVAIKVIETSKMNQVQKSLIQNEKKALRMLKHPNIMKLIHIEQQSSFTFIVSELYEGGSLQDFLTQRGSFNEQDAMEFFRKIISGYCAIVQANIIHRDLKPINILLSKSSEPVIIDFGYSQIIVANRNLTVFNVGSPSYMSPQAFTKTIFSQKSDVWSLGAIFYQLLTNKTLDYKIQSKQYFELLKNSQYPPINFDDFGEVSKQILKSALAVKSQKRVTAHKIKYLLDKEILGKKFQGKVLTKNSSQANQLRQTISNSNSVANFKFLDNELDFSKLKHDDDIKLMPKRPVMSKTYSAIPFYPQKSQRTFVHSAQSIQVGLTKKQQDCIIENDNQNNSKSQGSSGHGSLNITPSQSRIQYLPINLYQKSYSPVYENQPKNSQNNINGQYFHSNQNSFSSEMIQINNFHPKFQRQISINSNSSDNQHFSSFNQDKKSVTHNEGFYSRNKNDQIVGANLQKNKSRQQLFYSNQINPTQKIDNMRPNIQLSKNLSSPENYAKVVQNVHHNENFPAHVSQKNTNPVSMKILTRQLQEKAAVQSQNNFNEMQNFGLREKNHQIDQRQKFYQPQKLHLSQQSSPYQKTSFQQALRSTMIPQTQFDFQRTINHSGNLNKNHNQMFTHNQPFGQSIRNTIDHSSRPLIGLRKIV